MNELLTKNDDVAGIRINRKLYDALAVIAAERGQSLKSLIQIALGHWTTASARDDKTSRLQELIGIIEASMTEAVSLVRLLKQDREPLKEDPAGENPGLEELIK